MRKLNKALLLGAIIVAAGGTGILARAEMPDQASGSPAMHAHSDHHMGGWMHGARHGDATARLATLKADLVIRPEQTTAWDAYAKVVQDVAAQRRAAHKSVNRDTVRAMPPQERQAFITRMHDLREQTRATVRTAAQALLPSLDDGQKLKARNELPGLRAHHGHGGHDAARRDPAKPDEPQRGTTR